MHDSRAKCVIFDCEGTLINSETLSNQALIDTFAYFGFSLDYQECLVHFQGGKLSEILANTCERYGCSIPVDVLTPHYRHECNKQFKHQLQPIEGVPSLLKQLQKEQLELCVAANAPVEKTTQQLKQVGLYAYFKDKIFSGEEAGSWKPDPDLLHYTAMQMGYCRDECVYIDDTPNGIKAGIAADMHTYHYRPMRDAPSLEHPNVTSINTMLDLVNHIGYHDTSHEEG